ncbi:FAD/NAD(P)-binding domain-containing protein [Earliella scabrosa]|nr:FAD/NAD(P)-binding domain-containing protein [Earliella scabrosa]
MRSPVVFLTVTAAFFPAYAFQFPFKLPFFSNAATQEPLAVPEVPEETTVPNRIAIIGAGAGGSSAAFWIGKAKERYGLDVEVDVYDKNEYIGGRSITVNPYGDDSLEPVELGASIFVEVNKNLWRAVDEFGLERNKWGDDGDDGDEDVTGIWDGQEFVITLGGRAFYSGWLDTLKVLWRYGYKSPKKVQSIVKERVDRFLEFYQPSPPRWQNMSAVVSALEWASVTAQTMAEYFDQQGIDPRFTRELVEAATRVNYGQDVDKIHALEGLISLAPTGASNVKGGNYRIFEHFLAASQASIHLNTTVKAVTRYSTSGPWLVHTTTSDKPRLYRSVILAAPYDQTGISFSSSSKDPLAPVPQQPYVHLHVTLLSTSSPTPNASYFHLAHGAKAPITLLTTYDGVRRRGHSEPEFNSLTYHGLVRNKEGEPVVNAFGAKEWVVKIFSKKRLSDKWLNEMFSGNVGWVLRKEWDAYPVLPPTTEFPPVKLAEGLYYVNAFEPVISTMETETIASRNVVELLLQEQFNAGLCKTQDAEGDEPVKEKGKDFVYGWDC